MLRIRQCKHFRSGSQTETSWSLQTVSSFLGKLNWPGPCLDHSQTQSAWLILTTYKIFLQSLKSRPPFVSYGIDEADPEATIIVLALLSAYLIYRL